MKMRKFISKLVILALIFVNNVKGQGYNPVQYHGWFGPCPCTEIAHNPELLCSPPPPPDRVTPDCSNSGCQDECSSDEDCTEDYEICCCGDCGKRCTPAIAPPLPPANKTGWTSTPTISKPGTCPASDPNLHCFVVQDLCKSDCDCPKNEKCCYQTDCGLSCKPAENVKRTCDSSRQPATKSGTCPPPSLVLCKDCVDQCNSDCQCEGNQLCCEQPGCGNQCKDPVY